jgi:hypothetical protein
VQSRVRSAFGIARGPDALHALHGAQCRLAVAHSTPASRRKWPRVL